MRNKSLSPARQPPVRPSSRMHKGHPVARHRSSRTRANDNSSFQCRNCDQLVPGESFGTRNRNHCPHCLWSLHVDEAIGDRQSACRGKMEPIAIASRADGEWSIIHKCTSCGQMRTNRIAGDDSPWALLALASRPLACPPFPLG